MGTLTLIVGGGLLSVAVVLFVILPLVQGKEALLDTGDDEYHEEEFRRRVALSALRDVEYDYATGKMDEEDYRRLKRELSLEALRILEAEREARASDGEPESPVGASSEAGEAPPSRSVGPAPDDGWSTEAGAPAGGDATDALEAEIARIRRGLREGRACRACAQVNPTGSRFCGRCGTPLSSEGAASAKTSSGT